MMEQREKLIELLKLSSLDPADDAMMGQHDAEYYADYLLANGVVVLPCRCEECENHTDEEPGMVYCPAVIGGWVENDWFCADGKRKGGDE